MEEIKQEKEIFTPKTLFADINAEREIAWVNVVFEQENQGITTKRFYFDGFEADEGGSSMLYATACYTSLPSPTVLLIGPIGASHQVVEGELLYWAKKGYCAVALDLGGDAGQGAHTVYPSSLSYCNVNQYDRRLYCCDGSAKQTVWYHYCIATMRAVTLIKEHYSKDQQIYLMSIGGKASKTLIQTLAIDKRISSGCTAFGNLWEERHSAEEHFEAEGDEQISVEQQESQVKAMEENERWLAAICTQAYLPYIDKRLFVVTGSNGTDTDIEQIDKAMTRIDNRFGRALFFANIVDCLTDKSRDQIKRWFDFSLRYQPNPAVPTFSYSVEQGQLVVYPSHYPASICYKEESSVVWFSKEVTDQQEKCIIPVYNQSKSLCVYCNVEQDGFWSSSDMKVIDEQLCGLKTCVASKLIYSGQKVDGIFIPLCVQEGRVKTCADNTRLDKGALDIECCAGQRFGTFALSNYPSKTIVESHLTLDVHSRQEQKLTLYLVANWSKDQQEIFSCQVALFGGQSWQKISLSPKDFKNSQGKGAEISDDDSVDLLLFEGSEEEVFVNNLLLA